MPNIKSAAKRLRQSRVRNARNRSAKSALRTQAKKVLAAIKSGDMKTAEAELRLASKKYDQAGAKRIIHKNSAARHKSRLAQAIRTAKGTTSKA
jgi:small subunit ribosomal protein S20